MGPLQFSSYNFQKISKFSKSFNFFKKFQLFQKVSIFSKNFKLFKKNSKFTKNFKNLQKISNFSKNFKKISKNPNRVEPLTGGTTCVPVPQKKEKEKIFGPSVRQDCLEETYFVSD